MGLHKICFLFLAIILLPLTACATEGGSRPKAMLFTLADNGKHITLCAGQTFEIRLKQAGGTGYLWQIVDLNKTHLRVLRSNTTPIRSGPPGGPDLAGGPLERTWIIEAVKAGKTDLSILLYRSWEGHGKAADTFKLGIDID